jgi:hypothetical protein
MRAFSRGYTHKNMGTSSMPSSATVFFAMQSSISLLMMFFSIYMMVSSKDNIQIFLPVMTSISAYWLPPPKPPAALQQLLLQDGSSGDEHQVPTDIEMADTPNTQRKNHQLLSKRAYQVPSADGGIVHPPIGITLQGMED